MSPRDEAPPQGPRAVVIPLCRPAASRPEAEAFDGRLARLEAVVAEQDAVIRRLAGTLALQRLAVACDARRSAAERAEAVRDLGDPDCPLITYLPPAVAATLRALALTAG